jgi:tetratricopeptide (TPR) repeat protein
MHRTQQLNGALGEGNVAHTAMSGSGTTASDDPLQTAVWRLRSRGCWSDAAALLAPCAADPAVALQRASLLIERCLYTEQGWAEAEDALRAAEALAQEDDQRGAAACERGHLAYASTLLGVRDRADEARAALGRAAALIAPSAPGRPLLDYRRGLVAQNLGDSPQAARAAYRRAHAGATAQGDALLLSATWRHLAGLALHDGDVAEARHGFAESLRLREELGYLVGTAPALVALADAEPEPEATRLRAEARRLFQLLGGVPTWLADRLAPPAAA